VCLPGEKLEMKLILWLIKVRRFERQEVRPMRLLNVYMRKMPIYIHIKGRSINLIKQIFQIGDMEVEMIQRAESTVSASSIFAVWK